MNLHERGVPAMYAHVGGGAVLPLIVWPMPNGQLHVQTMALSAPNVARYFSCYTTPEDLPGLIAEFVADPETCAAARFGRIWDAGAQPRHTGLTLEDLGL